MKQSDLNRVVAHATGESIKVIDRLGFQHVVVPDPNKPRPRYRRRRRKARNPVHAAA